MTYFVVVNETKKLVNNPTQLFKLQKFSSI